MGPGEKGTGEEEAEEMLDGIGVIAGRPTMAAGERTGTSFGPPPNV